MNHKRLYIITGKHFKNNLFPLVIKFTMKIYINFVQILDILFDLCVCVFYLIKMPRLTKDQRVWICLEFARTNNANEVLRRWNNRWPNVQAPTVSTIIKTFNKFVEEGTCLNLNKERSGRRRTARTPGNVAMVRNALQQDGLRSARRNGLGLTRSSFLRIVNLDIKFHPYVLIRRQKLKPGDPPQRLAFCNRLLQTVAQDPNFLDHLIMSDEASFSLNSEVNTHNVVKYAAWKWPS